MDNEESDMEISEETDDYWLDLQVWDDELSDVQKEAFEVERTNYAKYNLLKTGVKERKRNFSLEVWSKKMPRIEAALTGTPLTDTVQRIQFSQKSAHPIVISSTSISQSPAYITSGRINYTPASGTAVSTVYTRPQISSVRAMRQVGAMGSAPPSVAQPMSVLHRNAVQQQTGPNIPVRATSVQLPVQQFQNLLFDANTGLLIMPAGQTAGISQNVMIRHPNVRQPVASTRAPAPAVATSFVAAKLVNTNAVSSNLQAQQQQQALTMVGVKRVPTSAPNSGIVKSATLQVKTAGSGTPSFQPNVVQSQSFSTLQKSRNTTTTSATDPAQLSRMEAKAGPVRLTLNTPVGAMNGLSASNEEGKIPTKASTVSITKANSSGSSAADKSIGTNGLEKATIMNGSSDSNANNSKMFPSLVVNVKPCLHDKPPRSEVNASRAELDQVVKNALVFAPSRFTEWLMQKGLLRLEHKCYLHTGEDGLPVQFKLGMYSDKDKEPFSGGYVWISECCSGRQISVYEGSIFDSSHHPPTTLLKLIYHWACQTSATNVLNWCKVSGGYLKNFHTLLRSVCVGALHELCPKMGGVGKYIEIGIITLGTTLTAPTGKKQVKIEILGVFDPENKMIRMKLINPSQASSSLSEPSKTRGVQILSPLNIWVEKTSTILIDGSIEQDLLLDMGFEHLVQCQSPNDEEYDPNAPTNVNVMNYLKHVVPKMFQNTLCVLSKSLIQQFLDELSWREKWGRTPCGAFDTILEHIKVMTNWDFGPNNNLVTYLNKMSMNPFQDWSYSRNKTAATPSGIDLLPESIRRGDTMPSLTAQTSEVGLSDATQNGLARQAGGNSIRSTSSSKSPVLLSQVPLNNASGPIKRKSDLITSTNVFNSGDYFLKAPKTIVLESYYYAELPGVKKDTSGEFPHNVKCPLCSKPFFSNIEVYRHIYSHVHAIGRAPSTINFCNYCLKDVASNSALPGHVQECHKMIGGQPFSCRICQQQFNQESLFVIHMWENHCEADTPYACELCDYRSSFHYQVIDHYNQVHKGSDSVMCPLCLKILSAKSFACLKQITVHIQTHQMRKGKKCSHCSLLFFGDQEYRAHVYDGAHKPRPDTSRKIVIFTPEDNSGTLMAKPPLLSRAILQPPAKKVKVVTPGSDALKKPGPKSSSFGENMFKVREHSIMMPEAGTRECLECETLLERSEHYPGYMSCIKCRFSTCCKSAMQSHHASVHPPAGVGRKRPSIKVVGTHMMDKPLLCPCGFESVNPNRLARHLAKCDKTTAYPLDWEEQIKTRTGLPLPEPLTALDHLDMMRDPSR